MNANGTRTVSGLSVISVVAVVAGCVAPSPYGTPGERIERLGDEIVVAGQLYHTGAPVVLWMDHKGYDAYRIEQRFKPAATMPSKPVSDSPIRYNTFRRHLSDEDRKAVEAEGWSPELLTEYVDQFVMHYDVCGTSKRCFEVLHDLRGLSVHFMLDVDGTIYQTLDVKERAWHAGEANDRSVGVEIANIGAYPDMKTLDQWYGKDEDGKPYITFPQSVVPTGVRTPDFVARPSRDEPVEGTIHGRKLYQYDLTDEQYDSLIKLAATLHEALPNLALDYPRDAGGNVRTDELTAEELGAFRGLLAHWHITKGKVDPGPAFNWERVVEGAKRLAGE